MYACLPCQKGQSNSSSNTLDWLNGSMSCNVYLPMVSSGRTSQWRQPNCIDPHRQHFLQSSMSYTDEITRLGKMPSPKMGGPLSVAQLLNMDYGVSVLGGPVSVMKVPWTDSKFKATSYYPVHPLILSATHKACSFPSGLGLGRYLPKWLTQGDSVS